MALRFTDHIVIFSVGVDAVVLQTLAHFEFGAVRICGTLIGSSLDKVPRIQAVCMTSVCPVETLSICQLCAVRVTLAERQRRRRTFSVDVFDTVTIDTDKPHPGPKGRVAVRVGDAG